MADTVPPESPFVSGPNRTPNLFLIISVVIFALAVGSAVYFGGFGKNLQFLDTKPAPTPEVSQYQGFKRAEELMRSDRSLISERRVVLIYSGTIESFTDSSWTITKGDASKTVTNEDAGDIKYEKMGTDNLTRAINKENLKVGDDVRIIVYITPVTGDLRVNRIIVIEK